MAVNILGYSKEELVGQNSRKIYPDQEEYERVGNLKYGQQDAGGVEIKFRRKDGTVFYGLLNSSPLTPGDYSGEVMFTLLDISERKKAVGSLRERELWISNLLELIPIGFTECDSRANIVRANRAYIEMTGYPREELSGKWSGDFLASAEQKEGFVSYIEGLVREQPKPDTYVSKTLTKDGRVIDTEVYWDYIKDKQDNVTGFVCLIRDVTAEKLAAENEKALLAARTTAEVEKSKAQELETAYRKLQEAQLQLIKVEKLSSIGILASGVAHELNSPLAGIISLLHNYVKHGRDKEMIETENLRIMLEASEYMANIVKELNHFARDSKGEFSMLNLNDVIESTLNFSGYYLLRDKIEIKKEYAGDLPSVRGDKSQLQQVILNMLTNARDAMSNGGTFTIRTYARHNDKTGIHKVFAEFIDTGKGIKDNDKAKIFDFFYTTKAPGKGVGLGLPISHDIMENHGGQIDVLDNPEGQGTVFRLVFPQGNMMEILWRQQKF